LLALRPRATAIIGGTIVIPTRTNQGHAVTNDLGGVTLDTLFVRVLLGSDTAFNVDLASLAQVFSGDFRLATEQGYLMPLGTLLGIPSLSLNRSDVARLKPATAVPDGI
jgi:hypothetical protein